MSWPDKSNDDQSMRIGGRARIGLIVSAAWVVGMVTSVTLADIRVARFLRYSAFEVCDYINYRLCHCGNCWRIVMNFASFVDHPLINLALIVVAPIVLAWSLARVTLGLSRWEGTRGCAVCVSMTRRFFGRPTKRCG